MQRRSSREGKSACARSRRGRRTFRRAACLLHHPGDDQQNGAQSRYGEHGDYCHFRSQTAFVVHAATSLVYEVTDTITLPDELVAWQVNDAAPSGGKLTAITTV